MAEANSSGKRWARHRRRDILEQECWLAAPREPKFAFLPFTAPDWPATTLSAFDAVRRAARSGQAGVGEGHG
jgi:hypothetical protein